MMGEHTRNKSWKLLNCPVDGLGAEAALKSRQKRCSLQVVILLRDLQEGKQYSEALFLVYCICSLVCEFFPILSMHMRINRALR